MFRLFVLFITLCIIFGILIHYIIYRSTPRLFSRLQRKLLQGFFRKLIYTSMLLCFVILVYTGFYPLLKLNMNLSEYFLMIHVTVAPIFSTLLAIITLLWAHLHSFKEVDFLKGKRNSLGLKISFWLMIIFAIPLISSIILSLYPIINTHGQTLLLEVHRYSATFFVTTALIHSYQLLVPSSR